MGTPDFSVPALQALLAAGHEIIAVYCQPPRPAGRGQADRKSPVQQFAESKGLQVRTPKSLKSDEAKQEFAALGADVAVVVAYGLILPKAVLDAPTYGCLNIHASLLPRWRGAAPIHRAIMAGDSETGISIMQMDEGLDTGPVVREARQSILPTDTTGMLHDRLARQGADLIVEVLADLSTLTPVTQPETGITYAQKIDKSEARIDWNAAATIVDCHIRGLSPFPGAWCIAGAERIKLLQSERVNGAGRPGEHLGDFRIACGTGAVRILLAQREGKKPLQADEFLRGIALPDVIN